jgi:hypothetical protein
VLTVRAHVGHEDTRKTCGVDARTDDPIRAQSEKDVMSKHEKLLVNYSINFVKVNLPRHMRGPNTYVPVTPWDGSIGIRRESPQRQSWAWHDLAPRLSTRRRRLATYARTATHVELRENGHVRLPARVEFLQAWCVLNGLIIGTYWSARPSHVYPLARMLDSVCAFLFLGPRSQGRWRADQLSGTGRRPYGPA